MLSAGCICECDRIHPFCWPRGIKIDGYGGDGHCYKNSASGEWSTTCPGNCTHSAIVLGVLLPLTGVISHVDKVFCSVYMCMHTIQEGWPTGHTIAGALPLAVDRVNSDNDLLPGHKLKYFWCVDECLCTCS